MSKTGPTVGLVVLLCLITASYFLCMTPLAARYSSTIFAGMLNSAKAPIPLFKIPALRDDLAVVGNFTKKYWANNSIIPRRVSRKEYDMMIEMLREADRVFRKWNITYFMSGGTLIGSYFHHDLVPWDDDLDLLADYNKRELIVKALMSIGGVYNVTDGYKKLWLKLYRTDGIENGYTWKWPFLDIFLYRENGTHWWEIDMLDVIIPLESVFPLSLRPFGPLWLPAPLDVMTNIVLTEHMISRDRRCTSNFYDHKRETTIRQVTVSCEKLIRSYPFVVERRLASEPWLSTEVLRTRNITVQEVLIPGPT